MSAADGGKMEPDVKAALVSIYRERTGADADAGLRWIATSAAKTATCWMCGRGNNSLCRPGEGRDPYRVI